MQSGLQAIVYLNLQMFTLNSKYLPQPQPQSQQSDSLVTYIIPNTFVSSPMIPDMHLQRSLHPIKLGSGLRTCQAWGLLVYLPGDFRHSRHCPDVPEDKGDVRTREKS